MAALKPPFTLATATQKVKFAQAMWNTKDAEQVVKAYTPDCVWRNRDHFLKGTAEILTFLRAKWTREKSYRLRKEIFAVGSEDAGQANRIAVQFFYEYQDGEDGMKWKRCYGLEDWTFNEEGKMCKRMMSGNDIVLGREGDGIAVEAEGIQGRWFTDGVDVDDEEVTRSITERHL